MSEESSSSSMMSSERHLSHNGNVSIGIGSVARPVKKPEHLPLLPDHKQPHVDTMRTSDDDHGAAATSKDGPFGPPKTCRWVIRIAVVLSIIAFSSGVLVVKLKSADHGRAPEQFHISLTDVDGEIWVTWIRPQVTTHNAPKCHFGVAGTSLDLVSTATTSTYTDGECRQSWCHGWSGLIYRARLTNVPPSAVINYQCGDDTGLYGGVNDIHSFQSPPSTTANDRTTVTFSCVGDIGSSNNAKEVLADLLHHTPTGERLRSGSYPHAFGSKGVDAPLDFHLQIGDIAYSGGDQELWDRYGNLWAPLAAASPVLLSPGNHDGEWVYGNDYNVSGSGGDSGEAYSLRYPGPGPEVTFDSIHTGIMTSTSYWWSINYGPVHITTVSGPHEFGPGSTQYQWIEADLAKADTPESRALRPWVVLTIHYPLYCSIDDCFCDFHPNATCVSPPDVSPRYPDHVDQVTAYFTQSRLEPLLAKYHVDLVLTGHEHCYERTLPVYNMTVYGNSTGHGQPGDRFVRPGAPVHVMVGTGGEAPDWKWKPKETWPWTAVRSDSLETDLRPYGWLWAQATHDEMHVQFRSLNGSNYVYDEFWIEK